LSGISHGDIVAISKQAELVMAKRVDVAEMVIRVPREMKSWLEREAERNCASQNSEVVRSIRLRMDVAHGYPTLTDLLRLQQTQER
jgi:hypothetical protein